VSPFAASEFAKTASRTPPAPAQQPRVYSPANMQPELPAVEPPRSVAAPGPSQIARNAFGLPAGNEAPARPPVVPSVKGDEGPDAFGPPVDTTDPAAEFGWEWETPRGT
jgi:hypothetical protein